MKARKLKLEKIIDELKEVYRVSTMETADFTGSIVDAKYPKNQLEVTPFIKESTDLWRQTWITNPLQDIIKRLKFEMNR